MRRTRQPSTSAAAALVLLGAVFLLAPAPALAKTEIHFWHAMTGVPDKPPATWAEVESMAKKIVGARAKCGFSTAWPSWALMENMHGWHDQPFADKSNGFDGLATTLRINGPFGVKVMEFLARGS